MTAPAPERVRELVANLGRRISRCAEPDADYRDQATVGAFVVEHRDALTDALKAWADAQNRIAALEAERDRLRTALETIRDLKPEPFEFPPDWTEQVQACPECQRYRGHPVQQGICNTHRRPLWDREAHESDERKRIGSRAQSTARAALREQEGS